LKKKVDKKIIQKPPNSVSRISGCGKENDCSLLLLLLPKAEEEAIRLTLKLQSHN
jgi:hypothetical protein